MLHCSAVPSAGQSHLPASAALHQSSTRFCQWRILLLSAVDPKARTKEANTQSCRPVQQLTPAPPNPPRWSCLPLPAWLSADGPAAMPAPVPRSAARRCREAAWNLLHAQGLGPSWMLDEEGEGCATGDAPDPSEAPSPRVSVSLCVPPARAHEHAPLTTRGKQLTAGDESLAASCTHALCSKVQPSTQQLLGHCHGPRLGPCPAHLEQAAAAAACRAGRPGS